MWRCFLGMMDAAGSTESACESRADKSDPHRKNGVISHCIYDVYNGRRSSLYQSLGCDLSISAWSPVVALT